MHDDRVLVEERLERLKQRVEARIHTVVAPLTVTAWRAPGEPVGFDEAMAGDYADFPAGTWWGPAWSTWWLRVEGSVPEAARAQRLDLRVDPHGLIQPDPVTMIDPLPNGPAIATQPAVAGQASPSVRPTATFALATPSTGPLAEPLASPPVDAAEATPTTTAQLSWLGWLTIGGVVAGAVLVSAIIRGRRV